MRLVGGVGRRLRAIGLRLSQTLNNKDTGLTSDRECRLGGTLNDTSLEL